MSKYVAEYKTIGWFDYDEFESEYVFEANNYPQAIAKWEAFAENFKLNNPGDHIHLIKLVRKKVNNELELVKYMLEG